MYYLEVLFRFIFYGLVWGCSIFYIDTEMCTDGWTWDFRIQFATKSTCRESLNIHHGARLIREDESIEWTIVYETDFTIADDCYPGLSPIPYSDSSVVKRVCHVLDLYCTRYHSWERQPMRTEVIYTRGCNLPRTIPVTSATRERWNRSLLSIELLAAPLPLPLPLLLLLLLLHHVQRGYPHYEDMDFSNQWIPSPLRLPIMNVFNIFPTFRIDLYFHFGWLKIRARGF